MGVPKLLLLSMLLLLSANMSPTGPSPQTSCGPKQCAWLCAVDTMVVATTTSLLVASILWLPQVESAAPPMLVTKAAVSCIGIVCALTQWSALERLMQVVHSAQHTCECIRALRAVHWCAQVSECAKLARCKRRTQLIRSSLSSSLS